MYPPLDSQSRAKLQKKQLDKIEVNRELFKFDSKPFSALEDNYLQCLDYLLQGRVQSKSRYPDNHSSNIRNEEEASLFSEVTTLEPEEEVRLNKIFKYLRYKILSI